MKNNTGASTASCSGSCCQALPLRARSLQVSKFETANAGHWSAARPAGQQLQEKLVGMGSPEHLLYPEPGWKMRPCLGW